MMENGQIAETRSCKQKKTGDKVVKELNTTCLKSLKTSEGTSSAQSLRGKTKANAISGPSNVCDNINQKQIDVDNLKIIPLVINNLDLKPEKSTNLGKKKTNNSKTNTVRKTQKEKKKKSQPLPSSKRSRRTKNVNKKTSFPIDNGFTIESIEEGPLEESHFNRQRSSHSPSELVSYSKNEFSIDDKIKISFHSNNMKKVKETCKTQKSDANDKKNDVKYVTSSTTESLSHYLQDEGNSQEPEEELLKYFKEPIQSISSTYNVKDTPQLRFLLEQNMQEETNMICKSQFSERDTEFREHNSVEIKEEQNLKNPLTSPQDCTLKSFQILPAHPNSDIKRRVSFENIPDSLSQSPIPCIKNFSFTPISPRPATVSKSVVNNPFVFPRDTIFRGKLSTANVGNHQTPIPSPVSRVHVSPHKGSFRSTSLSSTPSPITSGRSSSCTTTKGRGTPQDVIHEHSDSLKSSPLFSPSSSSGVFLSPASPISSCNSPVFVFRKNMSPVKQGDDSKSATKSNSLLQTLLLTGKCPETKTQNTDYKSGSHFQSVTKEMEPLAIDVQFHTDVKPFSFRSQSVPTFNGNIHISPPSNTLPFSDAIFRDKETSPLLEFKPNDFEVLDTVLKSSKENLVMDNISDTDTLESGIHTVGNDLSIESVISNLCDFFNEKDLSNTNGNIDATPISRSQPNTPLAYSESSNSSRDPIVSAFSISSAPKSYPTTTARPAYPFTEGNESSDFQTKNMNSVFQDNMSIPIASLSDDMDLQLNNFADLSAGDDTFNQLAKEVASSSTDKELL